MTTVSAWVKLALDISHRLDFSLDHPERLLQASWHILGLRESNDAGNASFQLDRPFIARTILLDPVSSHRPPFPPG